MSKVIHPRIITEDFLAQYFKIDMEEAKTIHAGLTRLEYKNDETIVSAGDAADGLYFIEEGQASVFNEDGEAVNEMEAGHYFGEYAVLADEPRLSTVKAHGKVVVYRMENEAFLAVVAKHPKITGRLLKQVYGQISEKHTRLASLTNRYRGVMWSPATASDRKPLSLLVTYGATALIFFIAFLLAPHINKANVLWQLLPVIFLMAFTIRTRRVVEGMLLTVILLAGMLNDGNFITGFADTMIDGIGNPDTSETVVIMAMVEVVAALLASAGVVSAFKKLAEKHVKTKRGSFIGMLLIMIVVCLDECLNVITAGFCMNDIADKQRIPRESRALLGSFSTAICSLIPFSLWSAYISGWVSMYYKEGGNVFLESIPFNLVGILALVSSLLLCFGLMPKTKQIKDAYKRVEDGGEIWPAGSKKYIDDIDDGVIGRPSNLLLPMLVWSVSSVVCGMLGGDGGFAMDAIAGLMITIIFMFILYVGQRLLTPKAFFEIMADGIGNSLMPILLLVFAERIAAGLDELGFDSVLERFIQLIVNGHVFLIPMIIFILGTLLGLGIGSMWGMYGLGIPIAVYLSARFGINVPLCLGAVFAAGIIGESLCPYLNETLPAVTAIGCGPVHYRKLCIQYWLPIAAICILGYMLLGIIFV